MTSSASLNDGKAQYAHISMRELQQGSSSDGHPSFCGRGPSNRSVFSTTVLCFVQSERLAKELVQRLPAAALAGLIGSLSVSSAGIANAADYYTPPQGNTETQTREQQPQSVQFPGSSHSAPAVKGSSDYQLPEGNQWRYSEFINAVQSGKVERVRFSKEGGQLQVCFLDLQSPCHRRGLTALLMDACAPSASACHRDSSGAI